MLRGTLRSGKKPLEIKKVMASGTRNNEKRIALKTRIIWLTFSVIRSEFPFPIHRPLKTNIHVIELYIARR